MSFVTDRGIVVPAVTADEMREVDRIAIEETGPNLFQMMENAGRALASAVIDTLGARWRAAVVVVLAGTGGNGGGGLAAGRHLANRGGTVHAVVTDPDRLGGVPRDQLRLLQHAGGEITADPGGLPAPDLVVDAVIGYGLNSAPRGRAADLIGYATTTGAIVVALDIPSGVDATTGTTPGAAIVADTTVTLALPKTGSVAHQNGRLLLADLGIPTEVYARLGRPLETPLFDERWVVPIEASDRNLPA